MHVRRQSKGIFRLRFENRVCGFCHSAIGLNTQEYDKWDQEYDKEDREPWSSGLWEETVFKRSWVHLRDVFRIDLLQVKRFVYWKRPKIIEKEDGQEFFIWGVWIKLCLWYQMQFFGTNQSQEAADNKLSNVLGGQAEAVLITKKLCY